MIISNKYGMYELDHELQFCQYQQKSPKEWKLFFS